jgi:hypothetical protein
MNIIQGRLFRVRQLRFRHHLHRIRWDRELAKAIHWMNKCKEMTCPDCGRRIRYMDRLIRRERVKRKVCCGEDANYLDVYLQQTIRRMAGLNPPRGGTHIGRVLGTGEGNDWFGNHT